VPFTFRNWYLSVEETDSALRWLMQPAHLPFFELRQLPNPTWDGRACVLARVGNRVPLVGDPPRKAVFFLGGVHAREWGSADILVNFLEELINAYVQFQPVRIGGKYVSEFDVRRIVHELDVFVVPQANPDGRWFSMHHDEMWRKNRRPPPGVADPRYVGVDINRNFPFLWDFFRRFHPESPVRNSIYAQHENYIGPEAASEPETRNIISVFDDHPHVRFFIDVHSYSELVLHPWGDEDLQFDEPDQNFRNPGYDGLRGLLAGAQPPHPLAGVYAEHINQVDWAQAATFARRVSAGIRSVRGTNYKVEPGADLFPTAGASDDYAFSRHLADPSKTKVFPLTLEWGKYNAAVVPFSFHPPYAEMRGIIDDVTGGLFDACMFALDAPEL
jgi:carboxypeptidase T